MSEPMIFCSHCQKWHGKWRSCSTIPVVELGTDDTNQLLGSYVDRIADLQRQLAEAEAGVIAQAIVLRDYITLASSPTNNWPELALCVLEAAREVFKDHEATLAAHDAKVAAEAKTEALEEAKALVLKRGEQICGAIDPKRTAIELGLKAAEYRAKATEAGRKG